MLAYPIALDDDDGTVLVTSPDFPELTTFGEDRDEAVTRAVHALEEALAARIHDRKDIPTPSQGEPYAVLPTLTSVKVMLYQGMRDQGVGKAELARRLGWHLPQVDRVLDVQHRSRLDRCATASDPAQKLSTVSRVSWLGAPCFPAPPVSTPAARRGMPLLIKLRLALLRMDRGEQDFRPPQNAPEWTWGPFCG